MRQKIMEILRSRKGAALIVAMLLLIILTILGLAAVETANVDIAITGHGQCAAEALSAAEAGAQVALEQLRGGAFGLSPIPNDGSPAVALGRRSFYRSGRINDSGPQPFLMPLAPDSEQQLAVDAGTQQGAFLVYEFYITGMYGDDPTDPMCAKEIRVRAKYMPPPAKGGGGGDTSYNPGSGSAGGGS